MSDKIKLYEKYNSHPYIRALVQLIPYGIGSGLDVVITEKVIRMRKERFESLLDKLIEGKVELTEQIISNEEFLYNYFKTVQVVINTKRKEKINYISQLFFSYAKGRLNDKIDEYEELLCILDSLSLREIRILVLLYDYENKYLYINGENDYQRLSRFWEKFSSDLIEDLSICESEINPILTRLQRTGLYETFTGIYVNYTGGKGKTTPLFARLLEYIKL